MNHAGVRSYMGNVHVTVAGLSHPTNSSVGVVFFHGGGWVVSDEHLAMSLLRPFN